MDNFNWNLLEEKLRQLEKWVSACKSFGGRWTSSWKDERAEIEVLPVTQVGRVESPENQENNIHDEEEARGGQ